MRAPVLILIDWQRAFEVIARATPRNNPSAEANAARLLDHWRARGWTVLHVRHDSVKPGSLFHAGAPGNAFMSFAQPAHGEPVIAKSVNSAFIGTDLAARLDALGAPPVVICGATTDHCVSTSTRMAGNLGYATTLVADATFTFERTGTDGAAIPAETVHRVHLASLDGEFAQVCDTNAVLAIFA